MLERNVHITPLHEYIRYQRHILTHVRLSYLVSTGCCHYTYVKIIQNSMIYTYI